MSLDCCHHALALPRNLVAPRGTRLSSGTSLNSKISSIVTIHPRIPQVVDHHEIQEYQSLDQIPNAYNSHHRLSISFFLASMEQRTDSPIDLCQVLHPQGVE